MKKIFSLLFLIVFGVCNIYSDQISTIYIYHRHYWFPSTWRSQNWMYTYADLDAGTNGVLQGTTFYTNSTNVGIRSSYSKSGSAARSASRTVYVDGDPISTTVFNLSEADGSSLLIKSQLYVHTTVVRWHKKETKTNEVLLVYDNDSPRFNPVFEPLNSDENAIIYYDGSQVSYSDSVVDLKLTIDGLNDGYGVGVSDPVDVFLDDVLLGTVMDGGNINISGDLLNRSEGNTLRLEVSDILGNKTIKEISLNGSSVFTLRSMAVGTGYTIGTSYTAPIASATPFRLFREWPISNPTESVELFPEGGGLWLQTGDINDEISLDWAHRQFRYRLEDTSGESLVSFPISIPNKQARLLLTYQHEGESQFSINLTNPGAVIGRGGCSSSELGSENTGFYSSLISSQPSGDDEGDTVGYRITYSFEGETGITQWLSPGESIVLGDMDVRDVGDLELLSIEIKESNGDWSISRAVDNIEFDCRVVIEDEIPVSDAPPFAIYRIDDVENLMPLNEMVGTGPETVRISDFAFRDIDSGIGGYLIWSEEESGPGELPNAFETVSSSEALDAYGDYDLSSNIGPVYLDMRDKSDWFTSYEQPLSNEDILFSFAPASPDVPDDGELRSIYVAAIDLAGNLASGSSIVRLDSIPEPPISSIVGYDIVWNEEIDSHRFQIQWEPATRSEGYTVRITDEVTGQILYEIETSNPEIDTENTISGLTSDQAVLVELRNIDPEGNLSDPVFFRVFTPSVNSLLTVDIVHETITDGLGTYTKTIRLGLASDPLGDVRIYEVNDQGQPNLLDCPLYDIPNGGTEYIIEGAEPRSTHAYKIELDSFPPEFFDSAGVPIQGDWYNEVITCASNVNEADLLYENTEVLITDRSNGTEVEVTILNDPPIASLSDITCASGASITLQALDVFDSDGDELHYAWDFGDGSSISQEEAPTHAFQLPDEEDEYVYTASLLVEDDFGGSATASVSVTVLDAAPPILEQDQTWTGMVTLSDDLVIPEGITLTLAPGTRISVPEGKTIYIYGAMNTQGDGVTIRSSASLPWSGITLFDTGSVNLEGASIQNALRGLVITGSQTQAISGVLFIGNQIGLHVCGATVTVTGCVFRDNSHYGIKEDFDGQGSAVVTVTDTQFQRYNPYYDEELTILSLDELNIEPNSNNSWYQEPVQ